MSSERVFEPHCVTVRQRNRMEITSLLIQTHMKVIELFTVPLIFSPEAKVTVAFVLYRNQNCALWTRDTAESAGGQAI